MNVVFRPSPPTAPDAAEPVTPVSRIEIYDDLNRAENVWQASAALDGAASPYQNEAWVRLWNTHVSTLAGAQPLIVAAFDDCNHPMFFWPFVCSRFGPFQIAGFFGGKHATLNMAWWRRDVANGFTATDMRGVLSRVREAAPDLDFLMLFNQPHAWNGVRNPFDLLPHHRSGEDNFILRMGLPGKQLIEREISSTMRGRLRTKERKLIKLPGYRYFRASTPAEVDFVLNSFFLQKNAKLTALGLHDVFSDPGVAEFIRAACHEGLAEGQPAIELHALEGDGEMLALFSGVHDGRRFTSMFNSHTASDHSRHSPGLILLQYLISDAADRGFEIFDIGPGEARYKTFFCKELEPIFDSIVPLSPRARMAALPIRTAFRIKSAIKHNPMLWSVASAVRRRLNKGRAAG
jgi:CelD/BcsL family acetyltransferase involved in cellulose biosynthesis